MLILRSAAGHIRSNIHLDRELLTELARKALLGRLPDLDLAARNSHFPANACPGARRASKIRPSSRRITAAATSIVFFILSFQ